MSDQRNFKGMRDAYVSMQHKTLAQMNSFMIIITIPFVNEMIINIRNQWKIEGIIDERSYSPQRIINTKVDLNTIEGLRAAYNTCPIRKAEDLGLTLEELGNNQRIAYEFFKKQDKQKLKDQLFNEMIGRGFRRIDEWLEMMFQKICFGYTSPIFQANVELTLGKYKLKNKSKAIQTEEELDFTKYLFYSKGNFLKINKEGNHERNVGFADKLGIEKSLKKKDYKKWNNQYELFEFKYPILKKFLSGEPIDIYDYNQSDYSWKSFRNVFEEKYPTNDGRYTPEGSIVSFIDERIDELLEVDFFYQSNTDYWKRIIDQRRRMFKNDLITKS